MSDLKTRVHAIVAATFGIPASSINDETSSHTLSAWDSMNHIHLIVALEGEFDVSFEPEQAIELTSVRAIEQALRALQAA